MGFRKKGQFLIILLSVFFLLSGCSQPQTGDFAASKSASSADPDRKIVRDASLVLAVDDLTKGFAEIRHKVSGWGGFLAKSNYRIPDETSHRSASLTIRVPAAKLDQVLKELGQIGRVVDQSESGEDITEAYTDLESRLRNLQSTEARLLKLMERAGTVKELLEVETEVTRIRGEIEQFQGRLQVMEHQVSFSEISLVLIQNHLLNTGDFWQLGQTFQDGWSMFNHLLRFFLWALIYVLFLLPFALPIGWFLRRQARRATAPESSKVPAPKKTEAQNLPETPSQTSEGQRD